MSEFVASSIERHGPPRESDKSYAVVMSDTPPDPAAPSEASENAPSERPERRGPPPNPLYTRSSCPSCWPG